MTVNTNVVMISWNALTYTKSAIERLFDTVHHPFYLTIVDNGSNNETVKYISELTARGSCIEIIKIYNPTNAGPGRAYSQGYEVSKELRTIYTCLCNNDLYFQDNWLSLLEKALEKDRKMGALSAMRPAVNVRRYSTDRISAKEVADNIPDGLTVNEELELFFDSKDIEKGFEKIIETNKGGLEPINYPGALVTCCALVRNKVVESVGFIADPRYEVYGSEDVDFSWEMHRLGYKYAVLKDVYVHHFRHRSLKDNNLDRESCLRINNNKLFEKWSKEIWDISIEYTKKGLSLKDLYESEDIVDFWFLRRINDSIGYYSNGSLSPHKFNIKEKHEKHDS